MAMATEASRSPSASADSYIGSLISLTSKSEIRYEGVLFNINTQESSIGLRNVRSFGTEGRKKDGPQVPPSDKVYEYILFRGSDIKDLQVKSSPPVQTAAPVDNDPAIIQSHYPQAPAAPTNLPPSSGSAPDISSQTAQMGLPRPTFQGSLPLYPPGGSLGSWGSSPPLPTNNGSGLQMPMYWQGFYGSSNGLQAQQQPLLRPPPGLSMPPSMQQAMQYPPMYGTLNTGAPISSQLSEAPHSLLPPYSTGSLNVPSSMLPAPAQSTATVSQSATSLIPDKPYTQALPAAAVNTSLPSISPLTTALDKPATAPAVNDKPKTGPAPMMSFNSKPEPLSAVAGTSNSVLNEVAIPSLVTPDQLLQPGTTTASSFQSQKSIQKDVDVVQDLHASSLQLPTPVVTTGAQEPLLPLPRTDHQQHGTPAYNHYNNRGGRGRGRENAFSRPVSQYTEEFDFMAMNEKFNKDEVWGHLGKSNKPQEDGDANVENNVRSSVHEDKPVYVKDDFFDSLSCDALSRRGGRGRFSDTETFGNRQYRGRSRGGYYGRGGNNYGYGYNGRGDGYNGRGQGYGGYNGRGRGYGMLDRAQ